MEISFHGRGARAGRNNNLLTSHARNATRYLASTHAFELPLSFRPFGRPRGFAHRPGVAYGSQSCQLQLSFIVSTIYDSVYTGGSDSNDIGPSRGILKFRSDSSARDRSYILAGDSAAHRVPFYRSRISGSPYSHLISHRANLDPPLLNYPCRNYVIEIILLKKSW